MKSPCLGCQFRNQDKNLCSPACEKLRIFQEFLRGKFASNDVYERLTVVPGPEFATLPAGVSV